MCKISYILRLFVNISFFLLAPLVMAVSDTGGDIAGVNVQSHMKLEGVDSPLVLNGAGIRYKFFFKIYVAALYLPESQNDATKILQDLPPNRMMMHITYGEVPYEKLVSGWVDGFKDNTEASVFSILEPRLKRFNQMFSTLHEGDVIQLDYLPQEGTKVTIKGELKGVIKGADFNRALLSVWLGENPVTEELKSALLGLNED